MLTLWILLLLLWVVQEDVVLTSPLPVKNHTEGNIQRDNRDPDPGFEISRTPDGGVEGSFSAAEGMSVPGIMDAGMAMGQTFSIGPSGMSMSNSNSGSFDSPMAGVSSAFSNANAMSSGPRGFTNSIANAAAMSNPMFSNSFANANTNSFENPMSNLLSNAIPSFSLPKPRLPFF